MASAELAEKVVVDALCQVTADDQTPRHGGNPWLDAAGRSRATTNGRSNSDGGWDHSEEGERNA
jgi:hypothetical protein